MTFFCILFPKPLGNVATEPLQPTPQLAGLGDGWNHLTGLLVHVNAMQEPLRFLKKSSIEKHCVVVYLLTCQQVGWSVKVPGEKTLFAMSVLITSVRSGDPEEVSCCFSLPQISAKESQGTATDLASIHLPWWAEGLSQTGANCHWRANDTQFSPIQMEDLPMGLNH